MKAARKRLYANRKKRRIIRKVEKGAKLVSARKLDYAFGGGRGATRMMSPPEAGPWTDCSGYASWLCQISGIPLKNYVGSTWSLAEEGHEGESIWFTMFIKNNAGDDQHIILRLRRRLLDPKRLRYGRYRWVECGGSDNPVLGSGPAWFHPTPERIAQFYTHRHFPGVL
ncbi:MAG: hypothetical protein JST59_20350 [Actinobacteria bacterium]|nr:hypothetical protein [Actinomycetota bacterium]